MTNLQKYLDFAIETAWQAGRLTLGYFQTNIEATFKQDDTPVTIADKKAEKLIRQRIEKAFPSHAIVGEEYGVKESAGATHRWFVDPIDGTKSFMRGVPHYAVLIGLEIEGRVEVGTAYFPGTDEMLSAATGLGCWWNGRRARVSSQTDLSRSFLSHIDTASFAKWGKGAAWARLQQATYYNTGWCDAYAYLLVATGRAEIAIDPMMNPWDCAPFPPIFREAGGYFGDWHGNETIYGQEALATNPSLLPQLIKLIEIDEA